MKKILFVLSVMLGGCATTSDSSYTNTMDVIAAAAAAAPQGVPGNYTFFVKAIGHSHPFFYLNTEEDYRDQRDITIVLPEPLLIQMGFKNTPAVEQYFLHKRIKVSGVAKREKIVFSHDGKPSSKYYYQTHILIEQPEQLSVEDIQG
ncbi:hypothetical protein HR45_05765 [Shewanella mangrovi]|uniref:Lipoprotein n=1 Tax=Shewanella mangrovi TaxID=1515746 RepID=A0A094LS48_9GAMM|nr:hypothetical protein [Shewanella mangrovi]KFZ38018.1 hypothetical protein HR45_05765 [Shewanella mangrovi]